MSTEDIPESQERLKLENKTDFAIKMRDQTLLSSERRRAYEWKFSILIWTALGSIIATLWINKTVIHLGYLSLLLLASLSFCVVLVAGYFQYWCHLANQVDIRRAELYEVLINQSIGIIYMADNSKPDVNSGSNSNAQLAKAKNELTSARNKMAGPEAWWSGEGGQWSRNSQIAITVSLALIFLLIGLSIQTTTQKTENCATQTNATNHANTADVKSSADELIERCRKVDDLCTSIEKEKE